MKVMMNKCAAFSNTGTNMKAAQNGDSRLKRKAGELVEDILLRWVGSTC